VTKLKGEAKSKREREEAAEVPGIFRLLVGGTHQREGVNQRMGKTIKGKHAVKSKKVSSNALKRIPH